MVSLLGQPSTRSDIVYTGFWYDRDHGRALGATLTLPDTQAAPLIAVLAILTTLAGNRSWYICRYLWHSRLRINPRAKNSRNEHRRRQQVVVRNSSTAGGAVISLLEEWFENGFRKTWSLFSFRDFLLGVFVFCHWIAFIALGILASQIVLGKMVVSKAVPSCGEWLPLQNVTSDDSFTAYQELLLNQTLNAESYVRSCYPLGDSRGILDCNKFIHRYIDYQTEDDVRCPFPSSTCRDGINSAFSMDSGNITFSQLGLNSRVGKQISIRRLSTCSVVDSDMFKVGVLTSEDSASLRGNETLTQYAFFMDSDTGENITTVFRNDNFSSDYDLSSYDLTLDPQLIPVPIRPEDEESSMVGIILLHGIGIRFITEQDDPFFSAHREFQLNNATGIFPTGYHRYGMDHFLNMIACDERAQFCSSITGKCTEWDGLYNGHKFNTTTYETLFGAGEVSVGSKEELDFVNAGLLVKSVLSYTSISGSIQGRAASAALQASRYLTAREQLRMQPDQWKVELKYWFATALARLQLEIYNTIEGPANLDKTRSYNLWDGTSLHSLCGKIKFNDANYTSMSSLGIGIVIAFCVLLMLTSMMGILLPYIPWVKRLRFVVEWQRDEVLALLSETKSEEHSQPQVNGTQDNIRDSDVEKEWSAKNQTGPLLVVSEARTPPI